MRSERLSTRPGRVWEVSVDSNPIVGRVRDVSAAVSPCWTPTGGGAAALTCSRWRGPYRRSTCPSHPSARTAGERAHGTRALETPPPASFRRGGPCHAFFYTAAEFWPAGLFRGAPRWVPACAQKHYYGIMNTLLE
eukprot:gene2190-biopygen6447